MREHKIIDDDITVRELGYIHFKKRRMVSNVGTESCNRFLIVPNAFIDIGDRDIDMDVVRKHSRDKRLYPQLIKQIIRNQKLKIKRTIEFRDIKWLEGTSYYKTRK